MDVTGIPDEELVVFAAATAIPGYLTDWSPVPAVPALGTVALALFLLGVGAWHLRKRV